MYELYKRVRRNKGCLRGSKAIEEGNNPFLEGPCLLCVAAMDTQDKSVFGLSKEGMAMARMRVKGAANAKFDIKGFPVSFLSLKYARSDNDTLKSKEEAIRIFSDKYFTPLVSANGKKLDCQEAMRNMRNVNIMSYCDGTQTVQRIEEFIVEKMVALGYSESEINKIQSQMCMIPVATDRLSGRQQSTCISFGDINDVEVNGNITELDRSKVAESSIGEALISYSPNEVAYLIDGNGEHSLKNYRTNGRAMPVCLSSVVSKALENSIQNSRNNGIFIPLSMEELTSDMPEICKKAEEGKTLQMLREEYDSKIEYDGARKLSDAELDLLDELDETYDEIIQTRKELTYNKTALESEKKKKSVMTEAMQEYCSDTTCKKILKATGYQYDNKTIEKINNSLSDKELIIRLIEKIEYIDPKEVAKLGKDELVTSDEIEDSEILFGEISKNKNNGERSQEEK